MTWNDPTATRVRMYHNRTRTLVHLALNKNVRDREEEMVLCPLTGMFVAQPCSSTDTMEEATKKTGTMEQATEAETQKSILCPITGQFIPMPQQSESPIVDASSEVLVNDRILCPTTGEFMLPSELYDDCVTKKNKMNKQRRSQGKEYLGYKKKGAKYVQEKIKPAKSIKGRCGDNPQVFTSNTYCCSAVSDEDCAHVFKLFWSLSWDQKRSYFMGLVTTRKIKKRRPDSTSSSKQHAHTLYLPTISGEKYKVCRKMLINTLGISQSMYTRWTLQIDKQQKENVSPVKPSRNTKKKDENVLNIKRWLDLLPIVPSHYCRANSKMRFVDSSFLSFRHMLSVFNEWCANESLPTVGRTLFERVLKYEKISIHKPRKDQCDTCLSFKYGMLTKEELDAHLTRNEEARKAKKVAKESANNDTHVITMDLQSVLLCPKLLASAVYYKQKLQMHNFTIYSLNEGDVTLYTWHEADGGVTSNEFTTCIVDYIKSLHNHKKIILISDGCNYQNRNKVLASALSDVAKERGITIEQIFLEKGHTMMEADNVHSVLEHYFKPPLYSPSDYVSRMQMARPKQPYKVKHVHFDFFQNYDGNPSNLKSLRPGKKVGDPVVTDIRALKYDPSGLISFKIDMSKDWIILQQRRKPGTYAPTSLFSRQIPIPESKFKHLQELKMVIDKDHHPFYDSLTFV